jgi:hypothetical protein
MRRPTRRHHIIINVVACMHADCSITHRYVQLNTTFASQAYGFSVGTAGMYVTVKIFRKSS